ncbi:MAG: DUF1415 domain-containing protein [Gammaproteobacteria bacterium]|nr:DUF1415 domain-containing protein [Gammaproteobacteria bacterium]
MTPVEKCKSWVEQVVIAHNFCPFAKKEFDQGRVHFHVCDETAVENALQCVIDECQRLDSEQAIATTLVIFSRILERFDDFWQFAEMADELLALQGYQGVYQLASFHPDYCFDAEPENDAANYTNRSPLPMLHLIREKSMERALASYPDAASIPGNNIVKARELGEAYFKDKLDSIAKAGQGADK